MYNCQILILKKQIKQDKITCVDSKFVKALFNDKGLSTENLKYNYMIIHVSFHVWNILRQGLDHIFFTFNISYYSTGKWMLKWLSCLALISMINTRIIYKLSRQASQTQFINVKKMARKKRCSKVFENIRVKAH